MEPIVNQLLLPLDLFMAAGLLTLAALTLCSNRLFDSCVYFIVFGLLMAIVWIRLHAPDIALAEAAIGSGLTGALLLAALSFPRRETRDTEGE